MPGVVALLDRRRALGCPRVVAELGTHGCSLLGSTSSAIARLWRAAIPAPLALALATTATLVTAAGAAAVAAGVADVSARRGPGGGGATPARTCTARVGHGEEGGVDDGLLVIGQADLLED